MGKKSLRRFIAKFVFSSLLVWWLFDCRTEDVSYRPMAKKGKKKWIVVMPTGAR